MQFGIPNFLILMSEAVWTALLIFFKMTGGKTDAGSIRHDRGMTEYRSYLTRGDVINVFRIVSYAVKGK